MVIVALSNNSGAHKRKSQTARALPLFGNGYKSGSIGRRKKTGLSM